MAKVWTVTPSDSVTAVTEGVYSFPANDTYDDKVYTVTVKDTDCNCVAHKTVKVKGKPAPTGCSCTITSDYGDCATAITADAQTAVKVGTFTDYSCSGLTTFTYAGGDADFVSSFSYVGYDIYADIAANTDTTASRSAVYNASCGGSLTVCQAKKQENCPSSYLIGLAAGTISADGGNYSLARFKTDLSNFTTALTISLSDGASISIYNSGTTYGPDTSYNVIDASVPANSSINSRTISLTCTLTHTGGTPVCSSTAVFTQLGGCPARVTYLRSLTSSIQQAGASCVALARFKNNMTDYSTAITVSVSDGTTMAICTTANTWADDNTWNLIQINVPENSSANSRTITMKCALTHTGGTVCSGYVTTTQAGNVCDCNAITVNGTYEADPTPVTPDDGKITVKVDLNDGTTSPAIHFVDSSNTQLLGVVRYTTDTTTTGTWKATGTCSKIKLVEMGGNYTRISITIQNTGQAPVTILNNATLPSTSGSFINLTRSFNVLDYYDSNKSTVTLTFR